MQPRGHPGDSPGDGVAMKRALARRLAQHLGGFAQRLLSGGTVGTVDRFECPLHGGMRARLDGVVMSVTLETLTPALFGRRMNRDMWHNPS